MNDRLYLKDLWLRIARQDQLRCQRLRNKGYRDRSETADAKADVAVAAAALHEEQQQQQQQQQQYDNCDDDDDDDDDDSDGVVGGCGHARGTVAAFRCGSVCQRCCQQQQQNNSNNNSNNNNSSNNNSNNNSSNSNSNNSNNSNNNKRRRRRSRKQLLRKEQIDRVRNRQKRSDYVRVTHMAKKSASTTATDTVESLMKMK